MPKEQIWVQRASFPGRERGISASFSRGPVPLSPPLRTVRAKARADAAARRRLVMTVLVLALIAPALVALATGSTGAWWVVVAMLPLVCTYGAVVLRARRLQAEREFNIAFMGGTKVSHVALEDLFSSRPVRPLPGSIDLRERRQVAASGR